MRKIEKVKGFLRTVIQAPKGFLSHHQHMASKAIHGIVTSQQIRDGTQARLLLNLFVNRLTSFPLTAHC